MISGGEKRHVEVSLVVKNCPPSTVTSGQLDSIFCDGGKFRDVGFKPRILMPADDNARVVLPQHQHMMIGKIEIAIEPVFKGQIRENVFGLRDKYWFFNVFLGGGRVRTEIVASEESTHSDYVAVH